jgi:hypothetical protein
MWYPQLICINFIAKFRQSYVASANLGVMLFVLLGQPSLFFFFFYNKNNKVKDERERKNIMRVWEIIVQSCQFFYCTNIIS